MGPKCLTILIAHLTADFVCCANDVNLANFSAKAALKRKTLIRNDQIIIQISKVKQIRIEREHLANIVFPKCIATLLLTPRRSSDTAKSERTGTTRGLTMDTDAGKTNTKSIIYNMCGVSSRREGKDLCAGGNADCRFIYLTCTLFST